jgi:hypothetical protein
MSAPKRVQLHIPLPYKKEPVHDPRVAKYLASGWRVADLQRLTDRDALVTLTLDSEPDTA